MELCLRAGRLETPGGPVLSCGAKTGKDQRPTSRQELPPAHGRVSLSVFGPSSDCMTPPALAGAICFICRFEGSLIHRHLRYAQGNVGPTRWAGWGPVRLTHDTTATEPTSRVPAPCPTGRLFLSILLLVFYSGLQQSPLADDF